MPEEEDAAPRVTGGGEALTDAQKGAILQEIDEKKRDQKKQVAALMAGKKAAKFNIASKKDEAGPSSERSAAGGGAKAVKALSPAKKDGKDGKPASSNAAESAAGGGAKAVLAIKKGGKAPVGGKKGGGAKKAAKGGLLAAAAAEAAATPEAAPAPAVPPPESAEERVARMHKEELEREAERARLHAEREEQRREIEQAIWAEERRLREKERKKREKAAAELKKQRVFREAAFDGEMEVVQKQIDEWVEETMGCTLIGAKVDVGDEHKTTALSEAACAGKSEICALLLKHGAAVNAVNEQNRTPLFRAAFMDHKETVELLLKAGADPRIKSDSADTPQMVAPTQPLKAVISEWSIEETERLMAAAEVRLAQQWVPPPPDESDAPAGQAGYFLQCPMAQFQDALDAVTKESDRSCLVADLGGKIVTYFSYRDCNMHCYARPADIEPERLRLGLLGALRFGKPMVLDMMSLELDEDGIKELFEAVRPGLWKRIVRASLHLARHARGVLDVSVTVRCLSAQLDKSIMREEHYNTLKDGTEGEEYGPAYWLESTTAHYNFVLLSKHPMPPEWAQEAFFVIRTT